MKRYRLLAIGLLLVVFTNAQNLYTYPIGVQTYTFRNHFPKGVEKTLDLIKEMGFTEIETSGANGVTNADFRKLCDARGISIPSSGADFGELVKDPMVVVERAKAFGAKFVMCAWIPHQKSAFSLEDAKNAINVFNAAGKILKENGLTLCYHDHGYEFHAYEDGTLLDYMIKNTNPQYVSFEMDVLWTMHGGGADMPVTLLKKYPGRFKLMHVKDLKKGVVGDLSGGTPAENDVAVGMGQGDWKKIIKLAKKNGVVHCFIEDESNIEVQNIPLSIAYLKKL
ncbi:MAG: TIM barrel protein [Bacteroidota bacterium]|jgi:sugar phosphate isomerase/epimerase